MKNNSIRKNCYLLIKRLINPCALSFYLVFISHGDMLREDRILSGIPGLDKLIGGGFLKRSVTLISGGPGSGKTIFALQMLISGAEKFDESGVYATLTETPEELRLDASSFGWNIESLEKTGKLALLDLRPSRFLELKSERRRDSFFSWVWRNIRLKAEEMEAKRIAIDSLNVLSVHFRDEQQFRQKIMSLIEALHEFPECISLLVFEQITLERTIEEFLTDGVIVLHYIPVRNGMLRAIQILKMRRTEHSENFHPLSITCTGIRINPEETVALF